MPEEDKPTDARARLLSHFSAAQGTTEHGQKWNELWQQNFLPWDKGFPSPALVDLLSSPPSSNSSKHPVLLPIRSAKDQKRRLKALVPGCGRGYDVLLLAAHGYDAYGLEISEKALEEAKKVEKEKGGDKIYSTKPGVERGTVTWLSGDFFHDGFLKDVEGEGKFDLIYDYTFLSALPPVMRPAWSKRFNELLAPEGRVICLEFPTYKPASTGGPPWALPPKVYLAHLPRPGEDLTYGEDGELLEEKLGPPSKSGLVRIAHFQPERTHEIGYNAEGKVTDWISVWAHP
ncbi:S-adenosyl-L-methionine-dependent methyltransferase [Mollisia scopiformis]|uniref:S-adenosyl-L-methionine-dependent methyltransferase n=1 Tax=Mollisia scopiformis TaxID=149040 RepID=A0A194WVG6_MOLSC|nr:S-adenosyl-L-methionine-dependent methyltransferase [Mollisia scopiformis]KUJ11960.1 S-adenosyl-L-methionine-dependent methyltransferase [Mollisia scopiformis]